MINQTNLKKNIYKYRYEIKRSKKKKEEEEELYIQCIISRKF